MEQIKRNKILYHGRQHWLVERTIYLHYWSYVDWSLALSTKNLNWKTQKSACRPPQPCWLGHCCVLGAGQAAPALRRIYFQQIGTLIQAVAKNRHHLRRKNFSTSFSQMAWRSCFTGYYHTETANFTTCKKATLGRISLPPYFYVLVLKSLLKQVYHLIEAALCITLIF